MEKSGDSYQTIKKTKPSSDSESHPLDTVEAKTESSAIGESKAALNSAVDVWLGNKDAQAWVKSVFDPPELNLDKWNSQDQIAGGPLPDKQVWEAIMNAAVAVGCPIRRVTLPSDLSSESLSIPALPSVISLVIPNFSGAELDLRPISTSLQHVTFSNAKCLKQVHVTEGVRVIGQSMVSEDKIFVKFYEHDGKGGYTYLKKLPLEEHAYYRETTKTEIADFLKIFDVEGELTSDQFRNISTNGEIYFELTLDHIAVVCRHFSAHWCFNLAHFDLIEKEKGERFNYMKQPDPRRSFVLEKIAHWLRFAAPFTDLIPQLQLSNLIVEKFNEIQRKSSKLFYVGVACHGMAMKLIKREDGMRIVLFYDPNKTYTHKRLVISDTEAIPNFGIEHFLTDANMNSYFGKDWKTKTCFVRITEFPDTKNVKSLDEMAENLPPSTESREIKVWDMSNIQIQQKIDYLSEKIYYLLWGNYPAKLKETLEEIKSLDTHQQFSILSYREHGMDTGFYMAVEEGLASNIRLFLNAVLNSQFTPSQQFELIRTINNTNKNSAFFFPLSKGYADAVESYIELIIAANDLQFSQKLELIRAEENVDGKSGINCAQESGHDEMLVAVAKVVMDSKNFEDAQKLKFLQVFFRKAGYEKTTESNLEQWKISMREILVRQEWLPKMKCAALMSLVSGDMKNNERSDFASAIVENDFSFLQEYMKAENTECVMDFLKNVLVSDFPADFKVQLIQTSNDKSGVFSFLVSQKSNALAMNSYAQFVLVNPDLTGDQIFDLLNIGNEQKIPVLRQAVIDGRHDVVVPLARRIVLTPKLNSAQKFKLLSTLRDDWSFELSDIGSKDEKKVDAWMQQIKEIVMDNDLTDEEKFKKMQIA
jgi:hypothetical protein